jgi:hypothetical protein
MIYILHKFFLLCFYGDEFEFYMKIFITYFWDLLKQKSVEKFSSDETFKSGSNQTYCLYDNHL